MSVSQSLFREGNSFHERGRLGKFEADVNFSNHVAEISQDTPKFIHLGKAVQTVLYFIQLKMLWIITTFDVPLRKKIT